MSEVYKKGKAGVGSWKAGTKSSTPVKLVERVSYSLKNWGRKREQWAQMLPPRQLALLACHWSSLLLSEKGNVRRKGRPDLFLGGDPQTPGTTEMKCRVEAALGGRRDLIGVMAGVIWGILGAGQLLLEGLGVC